MLKPSWDEAVRILGWPEEKTLSSAESDWSIYVDDLLKGLAEYFDKCSSFIVTIGPHGCIVAHRDSGIHTLLHVNHVETFRGMDHRNPMGLDDSFNAILALGIMSAESSGDSLWLSSYVAGCMSGIMLQNEAYMMVDLEQAKQAYYIPDESWPPMVDATTGHQVPLYPEFQVETAIQHLGNKLEIDMSKTRLANYDAFDSEARAELDSFLDTLQSKYDDQNRKVPLCVFLKGPSSIGKSSLPRDLATFLNLEFLGVVDCSKSEIPPTVSDKIPSGGLVFLDEIDLGSKAFQTSLRVALRDERFIKTIYVAAASGTDDRLAKSMDHDLLQRFEVEFQLKSLKERRADIPYIFLARLAERNNFPSYITGSSVELLLRHCTDQESRAIGLLASEYDNVGAESDTITARLLRECPSLVDHRTRFLDDDCTSWIIQR